MLSSLKSDRERPDPKQVGAMKVTVTLMCCEDLESSSEQISPSDTILPDVGRKRLGWWAMPSLLWQWKQGHGLGMPRLMWEKVLERSTIPRMSVLSSLARLGSGTQNSVQSSYWKDPIPESWVFVGLCEEQGGKEGLLERKEFSARKVLVR